MNTVTTRNLLHCDSSGRSKGVGWSHQINDFSWHYKSAFPQHKSTWHQQRTRSLQRERVGQFEPLMPRNSDSIQSLIIPIYLSTWAFPNTHLSNPLQNPNLKETAPLHELVLVAAAITLHNRSDRLFNLQLETCTRHWLRRVRHIRRHRRVNRWIKSNSTRHSLSIRHLI